MASSKIQISSQPLRVHFGVHLHVRFEKSHTQINTLTHNEAAWDHQALLQHDWSKPVSSELIEAAKKGQWEVHITKKPIPESWLPKNIQGKDILCLASAGGQQAPVLAAAGANVTVFDISEKQLEQDLNVTKRNNLSLKTICLLISNIHHKRRRTLSCFTRTSHVMNFDWHGSLTKGGRGRSFQRAACEH